MLNKPEAQKGLEPEDDEPESHGFQSRARQKVLLAETPLKTALANSGFRNFFKSYATGNTKFVSECKSGRCTLFNGTKLKGTHL